MFGLAVSSAKRTARRPPATPIWLSNPAITGGTGGVPQVGVSSTLSAGSYTGAGGRTYQWRLDGSNIGGATAAAYTPVTGDATHSLVCRVTPTDGGPSADTSALTVLAAGGGANNQLISPPANVNGTGASGLANVTWIAPVYWAGPDLALLAPGDIAGYKLYWSTSQFNLFEGGGFTGSDATIVGSALNKSVSLSAGTWYFAVAAINSSGLIGAPSAVSAAVTVT